MVQADAGDGSHMHIVLLICRGMGQADMGDGSHIHIVCLIRREMDQDDVGDGSHNTPLSPNVNLHIKKRESPFCKMRFLILQNDNPPVAK